MQQFRAYSACRKYINILPEYLQIAIIKAQTLTCLIMTYLSAREERYPFLISNHFVRNFQSLLKLHDELPSRINKRCPASKCFFVRTGSKIVYDKLAQE